MLSSVASLKHVGASFSTARPPVRQPAASSLPRIRRRPINSLQVRALHKTSYFAAGPSENATKGEFIADIVTQLDSNISEVYWPAKASDHPQSQTTKHSGQASHHTSPSSELLQKSKHGESQERTWKSHSANSEIPSSTASHQDARHKKAERHQAMRQKHKETIPYPSSSRKNDEQQTWQNLHLHRGSAPSNPPRMTEEAPELTTNRPFPLPAKPHTSHLTEKSIHLRQSIVQASSPAQFEFECEEYRKMSTYDPYTMEFSRLTYLEKNNSPLHEQTPFIEHVLELLSQDLRQLIDSKQADSSLAIAYTGEKFDLAISLLSTHSFGSAQPLLEIMAQFIDAGGIFDPPILPSTWRRIWTNAAFLVTQAGFANLRYSRLCQLCTAFWNHIYMNQLAFTGHSRRRGQIPPAGPIYISHSTSASTPESKSPNSMLQLELSTVTLGSEESPLLRGPQAVSAMLAILSHVSGHVALKRAIINLFTNMVTTPNAFPRRRMIPLASLLLSQGETKAAMQTLHQLQIENPPQIDPKSSQHELSALEFLMVSNNPHAVLQMADIMSQVPGHVPSPLALTHILWAAKETHDYPQLLTWWRRATTIWRTLPQQSSRNGHSVKMLVRTPVEATVGMLDIAADHFSCDELISMTKDVVDIFGIQPIGARTRVIVSYARDGRWEEAISTLNSAESTSASPNASFGRSSNASSGDLPTVNWVIAKLLIASIHQGKFDDYLERLISSTVNTIHITFIVGTLIDYVSSLMEEPSNYEHSAPWIPFLKWVASLPMPGPASTSTTRVTPSQASINQLLEKSRLEHGGTSLENQVRLSARTCARLVDIAGNVGLPDIVTNIINRVNYQYQAEHNGETMPFSLVWLRPLVRAHAFAGHSDIVFQLLSSLKDSMLPSERESVWKLAFKSYISSNNPDGAIQLFLSIRNKTVDDQIPTWSGGYTMGIQLLVDRGEFDSALQLYTLMIEDGFELRDRALVTSLITNLATQLISTSSPSDQSAATEHYERLKKRLDLLVLTLDDVRPQQKMDPAAAKRRRYAKLRAKSEKTFIKDLDRTMSRYQQKKPHL